jgi:hypothetical protein
MKDEQLLELAGVFSAFTLLGIIALWGGKVFYPFWLICAVIHVYQTVGDYFKERNEPKILVVLHFVFYTVCSPFYLLMSTYRVIIVAIEVWLELRKDERK